jgi:hypothetical protein
VEPTKDTAPPSPVRHLWIFPAALGQARELDPLTSADTIRAALVGKTPERHRGRRDRFFVPADSGWVVYVLAAREKSRERGTNGAYKLVAVEVQK